MYKMTGPTNEDLKRVPKELVTSTMNRIKDIKGMLPQPAQMVHTHGYILVSLTLSFQNEAQSRLLIDAVVIGVVAHRNKIHPRSKLTLSPEMSVTRSVKDYNVKVRGKIDYVLEKTGIESTSLPTSRSPCAQTALVRSNPSPCSGKLNVPCLSVAAKASWWPSYASS